MDMKNITFEDLCGKMSEQEMLMILIQQNKSIIDTLQIIADNIHFMNAQTDRTDANLKQSESLSRVITQNCNDIRNMIGEFKGILCIVRPEVKGTGWYGEEINAKDLIPTKTINRCEVNIDGVDRLGVNRKKLT